MSPSSSSRCPEYAQANMSAACPAGTFYQDKRLAPGVQTRLEPQQVFRLGAAQETFELVVPRGALHQPAAALLSASIACTPRRASVLQAGQKAGICRTQAHNLPPGRTLTAGRAGAMTPARGTAKAGARCQALLPHALPPSLTLGRLRALPGPLPLAERRPGPGGPLRCCSLTWTSATSPT